MMETTQLALARFGGSTTLLDHRLRIALELLIAGVAFKKDNKLWEVFSHDGDYLGSMSYMLVCEVTHLMSTKGIKAHSLERYGCGGLAEHRSFGSNCGLTFEQIDEIMARRSRNEVHLH